MLAVLNSFYGYPVGYWVLTFLVGLLIILVGWLAKKGLDHFVTIWNGIKAVIEQVTPNGGDTNRLGDRVLRMENDQSTLHRKLDEHANDDARIQGEINGRLDTIIDVMPKRSDDERLKVPAKKAPAKKAAPRTRA